MYILIYIFFSECRFIDFQLPHYNTPCVDVTYFMYTSTQPPVRRENYKRLLDCYHSSLVSTLERYGYTGTTPSFGAIEEAMDRLSFFGMSLFAAAHPVISCQTSKALDFNRLFETEGKEGTFIDPYIEEGMKEKIGHDLQDLVRSYLS